MLIQLLSKIKNYPNISNKISDDCIFVKASDKDFYWNFKFMHDMTIDDFEISQDYYDEMVSEIDVSLLQCPYCERTGVLKHTNITYKRSVIDTVEDVIDLITLELVVYYCEECNLYHALLPWGIIPFSQFTYRFVFEALYSYYFINDKNKMRTAESMNISRSALYKWIDRFESDNDSVALMHEIKNKMASVYTDSAAMPSGNDLEKMRLKLLERLVEYRAFLCAYLDCRLTSEKKPFMIHRKTLAKKNLNVKRFIYGKLLCFCS